MSVFAPGLRRGWTLTSTAVSLLIAFVGVMGYSVAISNYYYSDLTTNLRSRAVSAAEFFMSEPVNSYGEYYAAALKFAGEFSYGGVLELQFADKHGKVEVSASGQTDGLFVHTSDVAAALRSGKTETFVGPDTLTGERVMSVSAPLRYGGGEPAGVMRFVTSMRAADGRVYGAIIPGVVAALLLSAIAAALNVLFVSSIVTPLREITEAAKKIAEGRYGAKVDNVYRDELGELARTINDMSDEIAGAEKQKSEFMSAVTHELRTPLTAITGWGELLLTTDNPDYAETKRGLRVMLKETERLRKLVEELLDYSRMESGRMTMFMEPFDLDEEIEEVVFIYLKSLAESGIKLSYEPCDEPPIIVGDRSRLRQVALNLLDNAVKYGSDGGRIDVKLEADAVRARLTVRDYGQGIKPDELPHVKQKFFRGSVKARGTGIGLALCDEIVRMHDGTIDVASEYGNGAAVTVTLPVSRPEAEA